MSQVLQNFDGTSMASTELFADLTSVQVTVAGPTVRGSSSGLAGGKGCKFLGNI